MADGVGAGLRLVLQEIEFPGDFLGDFLGDLHEQSFRLRIAVREGAGGDAVGGQWAGLEQHVLRHRQHPARQAVGQFIQRDRLDAAIGETDEEVVPRMPADGGQAVDDIGPLFLQQRSRADARKPQELGRTVDAGSGSVWMSPTDPQQWGRGDPSEQSDSTQTGHSAIDSQQARSSSWNVRSYSGERHETVDAIGFTVEDGPT